MQHDFSELLKSKMKKLFRSDKRRYGILMKKIEEIIASDPATIDHYKNLKYSLSDQKRVHVDKSFVLTFKYDKARNFVFFVDFDYHDKIYRR